MGASGMAWAESEIDVAAMHEASAMRTRFFIIVTSVPGPRRRTVFSLARWVQINGVNMNMA
jgi:hypothetical protein